MKAMTNVFVEMSWRACAAQGAATVKSGCSRLRNLNPQHLNRQIWKSFDLRILFLSGEKVSETKLSSFLIRFPHQDKEVIIY